VTIGRSILFTAAGQSRIHTGFPLGAPREERRQQSCHKVMCRSSDVNTICCAGDICVAPRAMDSAKTVKAIRFLRKLNPR
jgi:hypothetical protein